MIQEIISMNGYGVYVWSAFSFTMIAFVALYNIVKVQYLKEQRRFNYKFLNFSSKFFCSLTNWSLITEYRIKKPLKVNINDDHTYTP